MPAKASPCPPPEKRPTLRTIAREAGLSLAATSMALRNHPGIAAATRTHAQAVARRLGYHPDPKLATLMQHLRTQSGTEYHETIAFLSSFTRYEEWNWLSQHDYYMGAAERATELGYRVEVFHLGEPGMTPARMSGLLEARGIRGLLVAGFPQPDAQLPLAWENFAAVTFDYSLTAPLLHRATTDYYREMLDVLHRLAGERCLRIGLNIKIGDDAKVWSLWRSAYLLFSDTLPRARRIPVNASDDGTSNLDTWVKKHRPDAIISAGGDFPQDWEKVYRRPPPDGIRYVNMNIRHADSRSRGIDKISWEVGRVACNHLVSLLQHNETGLPEHPQIIAIEGRWVENYDAWLSLLDSRRTRPETCYRKSGKQGVMHRT
ncbi:LacI family DNA-binding transcriptional regulator [Geminisphaera colitermitum]|uniref:LacI family DNA-binding transcriptional regulator n=1 Tax=Geminisphaera colitermitum TaxID=1148786 RepID=UPI000158CF53|nr:LacI family DNA-binding transcriptional regulator [Geminisphaera colitermitum]